MFIFIICTTSIVDAICADAIDSILNMDVYTCFAYYTGHIIIIISISTTNLTCINKIMFTASLWCLR